MSSFIRIGPVVLYYRTTHWRTADMQTLNSIQRRGWSGRIASLPLSFFFLFIARQHTDARYWCSKSVRPSVRPLRCGIKWKRLNISSQFFTIR